MRFVCAGDLHIGSGGDLSPDGPDGRLLEMEHVLEQIVDAAVELACPLLWAGDAWERRRPSPAEVLVVKRQFDRLTHGAVVIPGNHDVEAFERPTGYDLAAPGLSVVNQPGIVSFGFGDCQVACLPWAQPSRLVAIDDGADRDLLHVQLAEGLLEIARGLFAQMDDGGARILLGHWSISGASTPTGIPTDQFREPVLPLAELAAIGFDAVVFGHIHRPQTLSDPANPPIFYVGSPLPLNFGEAETDHCCWLLDVGDPQTLRQERRRVAAYQLPIDSPVLQTIDTQALEFQGQIVVEHRDVIAGAIVKCRVRATEAQARRLELGQLKRDLLEMGARHVWAVQVDVQRERAAAAGAAVDESIDDLQALELWLDENLEATPEVRQRLAARHAGYVEAGR